MRTAPGFSPGCRNRGSLGLYDSCDEEDEDAVVEVLVAVTSAIEAKENVWKRL